ncbi:MAG: DUF494 family protein [Syntrophothermus sp.]|nr:DUF494 family protein [Ignavibacteriaceae bacterium]
MISKLINVLNVLVNGLNNNLPSEQLFNIVNNNNEVDKNTVAILYSWVYERIKKNKNKNLTLSLRFFSQEEINNLGIENCNYLLHCHNVGLLTIEEINKIMDQLEIISVKNISVDILNAIILTIYLDDDKRLFPGSRVHLFSSDIIN